MADPAVIAQLQQLVGQLNTLQHTIGNIQAGNTTLTTRIATLEAENTTLTAAGTTLTAQVATSQEVLWLVTLPKVVQKTPPVCKFPGATFFVSI
jgi:hypothetical protein